MLKMLGALMVILGAGSVGLETVLGFGRRVQVLSSLVSALELMHAELTGRLCPLPELMETLGRSVPRPLSAFFRRVCSGMEELGEKSFAEIWAQELAASPELMLNRSETELLCELGAVLGRYDVNAQARSVLYTKKRMESFLERAEEEKRERSRLAGTLSLAAGAAVVIILI